MKASYLKNAACAAVTLLVAGLAAGVGCSMDNPAKLGATFSIKIEDDVNAPKYFSLARDLGLGVHGYSSQLFSPDSMTGPSTSSDFDCFAVNVTGPGVVSNHEIGSECTVLDNMHGRGEGLISKKSVRRGEYIDLDLLPGPNRRIDAYGIYPPNEDCGGSNNIPVDERAYYMGGVDVDIHAGLQVTIPVTFQLDQPPSVKCKHDLQLNAGVYGVHEVYSAYNAPAPVPSASPAPTPSPTYTSVAQEDYSKLRMPDQDIYTYTSTGYSTYYTEVLIRYKVTGLTLSNFQRMVVEFMVAAGRGPSSNGCPPTTGAVDSVNTGMQIWNPSITLWEDVPNGSIQSTTQPQFYSKEFLNPSNYAVTVGAEKYIVVHTYSLNNSTDCTFIRMDYAAVRLIRQ